MSSFVSGLAVWETSSTVVMTSSPVSGAGRVSPMVVPFGRLGEHPGWIVTTVPGTLRCVNAQIVRRTRLPADHNSPGLARVAIRGALQESGLGAVLDEALLLSTELVTSGVVNAGTDVELEITAGKGWVTVGVLNFKAGLCSARPPGPTWSIWPSGAGACSWS